MMKLIQEIRFPGFGKMIKNIYSSEFNEISKREDIQVAHLQMLIKHSFSNVRYYTDIARKYNLKHTDFNSIHDLNKLPILEKEDIKNNYDDFLYDDPKAISTRTGGTTGQPLNYKISKESYYRGRALLYNGWSRAGYKRGDKILLFAGGSLVGKKSFKSKVIDFLRNAHSESSFSVTDKKLDEICEWIIKNNPEYIRGYASAIGSMSILWTII